ncbi:MAG: hypothetical protein M3O94_00405 [Actinomycetota bacterium]|nr:hypothetical protein [Actinomycetota bacterium]
MARRLYLHIGTPKSATTYLQDLCGHNAHVLAAAGILWPLGDRYAPIRDLLGTREAAEDAGAWSDLSDQVRRHHGDVVFSNEVLVALDVRQIGRLVTAVSSTDVWVIITARDLGRVMPSYWQTKIRQGGTTGWTEFAASVCTDPPAAGGARRREASAQDRVVRVDRRRDRFWLKHDVAAVIDRWSQAVSAERITLVTVPPPGGDREEVARRFGSTVGADLVGLRQPEGPSNRSLGAHSAELMRRLSQDMTGIDRTVRKYGFRDALGMTVLTSHADEEPTYALSPAQQGWVRGRAQRMVDEIRAAGVRVEGDLGDLISEADPPPGAVDPAATPDAALLQAAERGLIGMVRAVAEMRGERDDLRAQLDSLRARFGA